MKPKVLIFSLAYHPFIGGAEIAVEQIISHLQADYDFDVITWRFNSQWPEIYNHKGAKIYRVGLGTGLKKYFYFLKALKKAKELHQQNNYHIVWGIMGSHGGLAAWLFQKKYNAVKYLLTEQTGDSAFFWWWRTWWWRPIFKKIYHDADAIQTISHFLDRLVKSYGYKGKSWIIPNGVVLSDKILTDTDKLLLRQKLNLTTTDKIIFSASRLVKKNALEDLIMSLNYLSVEYKVVIAGSGPAQHKLDNLARKNNLTNRVRFLGSVPYDQIHVYYSIADFFCRPSLTEGLGNVFLEAMALRVPVIATPVGGIVDFLINEVTGLFCQVHNPASIAAQVKKYADNQALQDQIINQAEIMVRTKYSWEKIAAQIKAIFIELLS